MGEVSKIAWTNSTFNPWIGCTKVSPGCDHCYAASSRTALAMGIKWGVGQPRHRTSPHTWSQPLRWNKKAAATGGRWLVFCASLADVFDNEVLPVWRHDLWKLIQDTPALTWLLLTKRIGNVAKLWPGMIESPPPNVWLGASIVNQEEADRDIPKLLAMPAAKRFVSYEPALGPVDFCAWLYPTRSRAYPGENYIVTVRNAPTIDWIIVGGESGSKARPFDIAWARSTAAQCKAAGVPVFVKQLGSNTLNWCLGNGPGEPEFYVDCQGYEASEFGRPCPPGYCACRGDRKGADPAEWPEDLRVQELPS